MPCCPDYDLERERRESVTGGSKEVLQHEVNGRVRTQCFDSVERPMCNGRRRMRHDEDGSKHLDEGDGDSPAETDIDVRTRRSRPAVIVAIVMQSAVRFMAVAQR